MHAVPQEADTVLLATPSDKVAEWVVALKDHPAVVFDVASVKGPVIKAVRAELKRMPSRFVPTHPVAGSELSGPEAASDALFDGCTVVLTPESETDASAVGVVQVLWRAVGAATQTMTSAWYALTSSWAGNSWAPTRRGHTRFCGLSRLGLGL